jgi:hypothetical protein
MISKVISPGKSFPGLCRYLFQNRSSAEVILSSGVREYDHVKMAADFTVQASQNPKLKSPVLHIILSWPPGETASSEFMATLAKEYMENLRIQDTQFAVVRHDDRSHQHLHLVINRVSNIGTTIKDNYIGLRGKKVAQQLSIKYGLQQAIQKDLVRTNLDRLNGYDAMRYEIFEIIHNSLPQSRNFGELQKLLQQKGITLIYKYKGQTKEIQGISFSKGEFRFKGSEVDRAFSYLKLQKLFALKKNQLSIKTGRSNRVQIMKEGPEQLLPATKLLYELMKPEFTPDWVTNELIKRKKKKNKLLGL